MDTQEYGARAHRPHFVLCLLLTAGEFCLLSSLFYLGIPESNQRIADVMFGSYSTAWLTAIGYFYQTTFGSNNKTSLLAKAEPIKESLP